MILHFEVFPTLVAAGAVELTTSSFGEDDKEEIDITATVLGLGVGVTTFIMPADVYLSASVGLGFGSYEDDHDRDEEGDRQFDLETDAGFALAAAVGKAWRMSGDWGLGLAGRFYLMSLPPDAGDRNLDQLGVLGGGILFSAIQN